MDSNSNIDWIKLAQILFVINALVWLVFGVLSLARMTNNNPELMVGLGIILVLMFGNVGAMVVSAVLLPKRNKWFYNFALAVLLINLLLTFTDQFGLFDFLTLLLDLIILGILVVKRRHFYGHPAQIRAFYSEAGE